MHANTRTWLQELKNQYTEYFTGAKVLELGSLDVNGSARDFFHDSVKYIGIDVTAGDGVDIVVHAKNTLFWPEFFDTLVCLSMLEHDPSYIDSLMNNFQWVRKGGLLILSWGAEGNLPHMQIWKPVPSQPVVNWLKGLGWEILDSFFEEERYGLNCAGCFNLIAKKP